MSQFFSKKRLLRFILILKIVSNIAWARASQVPLLALEEDNEEVIPVLDVKTTVADGTKKKRINSAIPTVSMDGSDSRKQKVHSEKMMVSSRTPQKRSMRKEVALPQKVRRVEFVGPEKSKKDIEEVLEKKSETTDFFDLTATDQSKTKRLGLSRSPLELSSAWKEMMRQDFEDKTSYLSTIIHQGEDNEQEKEDFTSRFKKNKEWVNQSLAIITSVADPQFNALMQRKDRIDMLVKAQQQADILIQNMNATRHIPSDVVRHVRLAVLYALNDLIGSHSVLPSSKKIESLVEEKTLKYGDFRAKGTVEERPTVVENLELEQEVERLRKVLKEQTEKYESDYEALLKQLKDTERTSKETEERLLKIKQDLVQAQQVRKDAELKSSIAEQARKEATYSASKTIEESSKKNFELEVALEQAEREKIEAERALRRALADYKEVNELVALLQHEARGLTDQNTTLALSLEKAEQDKSTLELEKKHIQRQYNRFKKEIADLNKKLLEQKDAMDALKINIEKVSNEKDYAVTQIQSMRKLQENYSETEKALSDRLKRLQKQIAMTQDQAKEIEGLARSLQKEHTATLEHIQALETIKKDNQTNRKILKDEIGRVMQEQVEHRVKLEELQSSFKKDDVSKKRKRQIKKEMDQLKNAQEAAELDLAALQEMYQTTQVQDDSLGVMLQELKSYVFDQDLELAELQKAVKGHQKSIATGSITAEEQQIAALKRKNRALKNRLASVEAKLQAKQASKAEEYFSKPMPSREDRIRRQEERRKKREQEEADMKKTIAESIVSEEDGQINRSVVKQEESIEEKIQEVKDKLDAAEALDNGALDISKKEPILQQSQGEGDGRSEVLADTEKGASEPSVSIEEIVGKSSSGSSPSVSTEKPIAFQQQTSVQPVVPTLPGGMQTRESGSGKKIPLPSKDEMKQVVDSIKQTISDNPEEFENFMQQVQPPSEEQIQQAQKEIEAMSPEEREQFEEFMQNFVSSLVGDETK